MRSRIDLQIQPQPTPSTCGPTCLHALYGFYGDEIALSRVISDVGELDEGGTHAVMLGLHALRRGYRARIYSYNLLVFDPTWFHRDGPEMRARLAAQIDAKTDPKLRLVSKAYLEYLELGGEVRMQDLTHSLVRKHLKDGTPLLTGLSSTWLYQGPREINDSLVEDDVKGVPQGHFVLLCGYDKKQGRIAIADPLEANPVSGSPYYEVDIDRLVTSILLGILTYDANLLLIRPSSHARGAVHDDPDRRRQH